MEEELKDEKKSEEISEDSRIRALLNSQTDQFKLDLSGQSLYDIKLIMEEFRSGKRPYISEIDLSTNQLMQLTLEGIPTLLTLRVPKNCLKGVALNIPSLQILDLTSNSLDSVPKLYELVKLDQLFLGKNQITKFDPNMLPSSLTILDVSDNLITMNHEEYIRFVQGFKRFIHLEQLIIDKNEFNLVFPSYVARLTAQCKRLVTINRNPVLREEGAMRLDDLDSNQQQDFKSDKDIPKLDGLLKCIENARKFPPSCQTEINNLMQYTELLLNVKSDKKLEQGFGDITMQRDFFEQLEMLHSSQPKYRKQICIILARLFSVRGIGEGSMHQLIRFMKSSSELCAEILPVISDHILRKLTMYEELHEMPIETLELLSKMAKEVDLSSCLSILFDRFVEYVIKTDLSSNFNLSRIVMSLVAASVKTRRELAAKLVKKENPAQTSKGKIREEKTFVRSLRALLLRPNIHAADASEKVRAEFDTYRSVLEIVEYCSKHSRDAASQLCSKFHSEFLSCLETSLGDYQSLKNDKQDLTNLRQEILVSEIFASEIFSFSGLLNTNNGEDISAIYKHPKKEVLRKIIGLVTQGRLDPKVLTAICRLALSLFKAEQVLKNAAVFFLMV